MDLSRKEYISPECNTYELQYNTVLCGSRRSEIDDVDYEDFTW